MVALCAHGKGGACAGFWKQTSVTQQLHNEHGVPAQDAPHILEEIFGVELLRLCGHVARSV